MVVHHGAKPICPTACSNSILFNVPRQSPSFLVRSLKKFALYSFLHRQLVCLSYLCLLSTSIIHCHLSSSNNKPTKACEQACQVGQTASNLPNWTDSKQPAKLDRQQAEWQDTSIHMDHKEKFKYGGGRGLFIGRMGMAFLNGVSEDLWPFAVKK